MAWKGGNEKLCRKCNTNKKLVKFGNDKRSLSGKKSACKLCESKRQKIYREKHKDRISEEKKKYYLDTKQERLITQKQYRLNNKEKIQTKNKKYNNKNRERIADYYKEYNKTYKFRAKQLRLENIEHHRKKDREYSKANRGKRKEATARYRTRLLNATPKWLTEDHWVEIREIYQDSVDLRWLSEEPLEVDHIIPLQGKEVCGLHVPWNLQILPRTKNREKSNGLQ